MQSLLSSNRIPRKLNDEEHKRVKRLQAILRRAQSGEHIQNRMLKVWLTDDEYSLLDDVWENQKLLRDELLNKPDEIKEYEDLLRQALFVYHRADKYSTKGIHKTAGKLMNQADGYFERVLEKAEEINTTRPDLRHWFDRDPSQTSNNLLGLSPDLVPRIITSRSLIKQSGGLQNTIMNINEVKQYVIRMALDSLLYAPSAPSSNSSRKSKLEKLLEQNGDGY